VNLAYRTARTSLGTFGFTWNNNFLRNYDILVPTATGTQKISREGTEQGSPDQAFPKWKSIGILDWDLANFGATLTGRYIKSVRETEADNNKLNSRLYTDLQLRWFGIDENRFGFALGVNNLFDKDPPGCISCGLNNFDPTTYDVPGRYLYARATVRM
jgi:iron complex outermembrane receptor protein